MSTEDFSKKSDRTRKDLNTLRKDINFRDEQDKRGEATYTLDAEINGQFNQITEALKDLEMMVNNFRNNYKDYNLTLSEANKRVKVFQQLTNQKNTLKRSYDSLFQKKTAQRELLANNAQGKDTFDKKYEVNNLSNKELNKIRGQQDQQQEEVLDQLINNVKALKGGQKNVGGQLTDQQKLLETLDNKMDDNIDNMSAARRRLTKLLESSSNCCLISVMIVEIAAIVVIWVLL